MSIEEVGAIAAIVAAGAAMAGLCVAWFYGSRARSDAANSARYERLAEARRLVGEIRGFADNTHWSEVRVRQSQLRSVLSNLELDLPKVTRLAETAWGPATYESDNLQGQSEAARVELDDATNALAD
jgi:hypothetical protein